MAVVELREVWKSYGAKTVLRGLSLEAPAGRITAVLGPSGSGKTTMLRIIAGLEEPDRGAVLMDGRDVTSLEPRERGVSMVFQYPALFPHMTAYENIMFAARRLRLPRDELDARIRRLANLLEIDDILDKRPGQLSGGQQQRVALARALVVEPRVLLLDEPLSHIDARLRESLKLLIRRIRVELGITMIYVTHDQDEALEVGDKVAVLVDGVIVAEGDEPYTLYLKPGHPEAARLFLHNMVPVGLSDQPVWPWTGNFKGSDAVAGFPPEAVRLGEGPWEGVVEDVVAQRGRILVVLRVGETVVRCYVPHGGHVPRTGDRVRFGLDEGLVSVYRG